MSEVERIEKQARPYAMKLFLLYLTAPMLFVLIYFTELLTPLRVPFAFGLLLIMAYAMYLTLNIYRLGIGKLPRMWLFAGIILIVGGIAVDVFVTVVKSPSLSDETNPIARLFLDSGYSVGFVYVFGLIAQSMYAASLCLMWVTFLRHHRIIIELAWRLNPKTPREFMNAAIRGKDITRLWWGYRLSDYRDYKWYRPAQFLFAAIMAVPVGRLYLGLEWLGAPYMPRSTLAVTLMLLAVVPYYIWLRIEYSKGTTVPSAQETQ